MTSDRPMPHKSYLNRALKFLSAWDAPLRGRFAPGGLILAEGEESTSGIFDR